MNAVEIHAATIIIRV